MKKLLIIAVILGGLVAIVIVAGAAYIFITGGSGEASEEISAPTLEANNETLLFRIDKEESEVRFVMTEDLRGQFTTVTGRTNEVAGDIQIDTVTPANSTVGTIRINVRTLQTDNEFRNRAIRSQILESAKDEYEFSQFAPTSLVGLPDSVEVGTPFTFMIVGDLTVKDITNVVTFEAEVTPVSESQIVGTASTSVLYADFGMDVDPPTSVANVSEEVVLEIDFTANLVTEDEASGDAPSDETPEASSDG